VRGCVGAWVRGWAREWMCKCVRRCVAGWVRAVATSHTIQYTREPSVHYHFVPLRHTLRFVARKRKEWKLRKLQIKAQWEEQAARARLCQPVRYSTALRCALRYAMLRHEDARAAACCASARTCTNGCTRMKSCPYALCTCTSIDIHMWFDS